MHNQNLRMWNDLICRAIASTLPVTQQSQILIVVEKLIHLLIGGEESTTIKVNQVEATEQHTPTRADMNISQDMECKRQIEVSRTAIEGLQIYYAERRSITRSFKSNWRAHASDFIENRSLWDVPGTSLVFLFRCSLADNADARQCHKSSMMQAKITSQFNIWKQLRNTFSKNTIPLQSKTRSRKD